MLQLTCFKFSNNLIQNLNYICQQYSVTVVLCPFNYNIKHIYCSFEINSAQKTPFSLMKIQSLLLLFLIDSVTVRRSVSRGVILVFVIPFIMSIEHTVEQLTCRFAGLCSFDAIFSLLFLLNVLFSEGY